jgi:predicted ATPase
VGVEAILIATALLFSRYRAFLEHSRLELAPLTVIIGKNGSGKSVLTRLPLLLSSGLGALAESPLDLNAGGIKHATRFEDIIYQRSAQPFTLGAEISDGNRKVRFLTTLRHIVERYSLGIEAFELFDGDQCVVDLAVKSPEDIGNPEGIFSAKFGNEAAHDVHLKIAGLFPTDIVGNNQLSNQLRETRAFFEKVFTAPSYLGPFRSEQGALARIPRQGVRDLGPRGEHALDIVGDDRLRADGALVSAVEAWFESSMDARMKLEMTNELPRMLVHDPARNIDVDIADTGAGFAQLFPVVVQAYARTAGRITSPIVIVEQPELHLHPGAHGRVADLITETVTACDNGVRYICETHSEQIITRIRRRVAEGKFAAEKVNIISVGHESGEDATPDPLRTIKLDKEGNPSSWPTGVFDEAFEDLVELRKAVQEHTATNENTQA